ncbi:centrosomal protein 20 isoform X2 [Sorex araneus]|uniref:centrosomal protein 20 isoform X2 n=1 Tax=Sorex araneus TaxID=42254 RepID=UPI002433DBFB|nr:centrosomal protein 20 isoform X2 [Sorex araneus]
MLWGQRSQRQAPGPESGQPVIPLDRQFLIRELNAFEESKDNTVPLLYGILAHLSKRTKEEFPSAFAGSSPQPAGLSLGRHPIGRKPTGGRLRTEGGRSASAESPRASHAARR